ncbi:hypothetical protein D3C72_2331790 [compost metagenome]
MRRERIANGYDPGRYRFGQVRCLLVCFIQVALRESAAMKVQDDRKQALVERWPIVAQDNVLSVS